MNKRVLMIGFHYPPVRGSSGVQRTLKFSRYLIDNGWEPIILTAEPRAYPDIGSDLLGEIPPGITVVRAFALDSARHLSLRGSYPSFLALPDRWSSWWLGAVPAGLGLIRRMKPAAIWSTYPIATAHLIALTLKRLARLPWIADFRDSMTEDEYPRDPAVRRVYRRIERSTITHASRCVFTAPSTLRMYAERYPHVASERWSCLPNGYDEADFARFARGTLPDPNRIGPPVLLHSGILYPVERDPRPMLVALARLKQEGAISAATLRLRLRATGHDSVIQPLIDAHGVGDIVVLEPPVTYAAALEEMCAADGLLVMQASDSNHQIPAKVYEYLRAHRPIFAVTDPAGDTANLLRSLGVAHIARLDSPEDIAAHLLAFLTCLRSGTAPALDFERVRGFSRQSQARDLAQLLDTAVGSAV